MSPQPQNPNLQYSPESQIDVYRFSVIRYAVAQTLEAYSRSMPNTRSVVNTILKSEVGENVKQSEVDTAKVLPTQKVEKDLLPQGPDQDELIRIEMAAEVARQQVNDSLKIKS